MNHIEKQTLPNIIHNFSRIRFMAILYSIPIFLSSLLITAHFYRNGATIVALFCLVSPALLLLRRSWVPKLSTCLLLLFSLEWIRTTVIFVEQYKLYGKSYEKLVTIMALVILFTLFSAIVFRAGVMRETYRDHDDDYLVIRR